MSVENLKKLSSEPGIVRPVCLRGDKLAGFARGRTVDGGSRMGAAAAANFPPQLDPIVDYVCHVSTASILIANIAAPC